MRLVGLERPRRLLEAPVRDLPRRFDPRAVVRRLAEVAPELVAAAERSRGDEAPELVDLDLERLVGGECCGELPDERLRLPSIAALDRVPGTLAERAPERLRIADLAGADKHDPRVLTRFARCAACRETLPRARAGTDLHVPGRTSVLEECRRAGDRGVPVPGHVVVDRALGHQPLLVVASEAPCQLDTFPMQLGRPAEIAGRADDRREIQAGARREVGVRLEA